MKFTSLLKTVILEQSRFELLFDALTKPSKDKEGNKVKPRLSKDEFVALVNADPTTRANNVDMETADSKELAKVKAGKYVQWLIKSYLSPSTERQPGENGYDREVKQVKDTFMEDLYKVTDDLIKFEKFKNKLPQDMRDINKLSPSSLYDAVKDFDLTIATTTKAERKSAPVHPGSKLLYDGPTWRVIEIKDKGAIGKEAACFYGGNQQETRWCTSAPGLSYFERYIKDGPLYVVYKSEDTDVSPTTGLPKERYQFHFPSNQFMDKDDRSVDLVKYLNGPSTLKEFQIQNRDKNDVTINIPESIGRFKDLTMILFDNCVDHVPDSICTLPKLRFLALINNQKLTEIPECVSDLPNLFFLNLKGSPNVRVPESVQAKGTDMGGGMWDLQD